MLYLEGRDGSRVRRWPLRVESFAIGRGADCEIVIDDPLLSNRHLLITIELDGAWVRDQDSENGLWIDGERVSEAHVPFDHPFAAGGTTFTIRERFKLVPHPSSARTATQIDAPQVSVVRQAQASSNSLNTASIERNTGKSPLPPWVKSVADMLNRGAATHDQLLCPLLAAAAQISGTATAALLRGTPYGIVLEALHGPPLPDSLNLDASTLHREFSRYIGCIQSPPSDSNFGVIEDNAVDGGPYWLVVCPAPYAPLAFSPTLLLLAGWAFREAARLPRVERVLRAEGFSTTAVPTPDASPPSVVVAASSRAVVRTAQRVAPSELPVVIVGESGTGKKLLAKRIHAYSPRMDKPFIAVDCASTPAELLEAELFGVESSTVSGEPPRIGRMAQAHGGTLFLEAIGDLPPALQPKLLHALMSRQITPLGATAPIHINLRLISTSPLDLLGSAAGSPYLPELAYRLSGFTLHVLPLRERPEDILPLARQFALRAARDCKRPFIGIDLEAARLLLSYAWPGNVRELKHAIESAVASRNSPTLLACALPPEITRTHGR